VKEQSRLRSAIVVQSSVISDDEERSRKIFF
jgi:hypothetical protein